MKILFTVDEFTDPRGTQSGIIAMCSVLSKIGAEPRIYSPKLGECARLCHSYGLAKCSSNLMDLLPWDITWGNHQCLGDVSSNAPRMQFIHDYANGKLIPNNNPVKGVDLYVPVTQTISDHLPSLGIAPYRIGPVMPQAIDMMRFMPSTHMNEKPKRIAYVDSGHDMTMKYFPLVKQAVEAYGCEFLCAGPDKLRWDVEVAYNLCDIVVASTRCAIEAMACGRNVVVMSSWDRSHGVGLSGMVTPFNVKAHLETNYMGTVQPKKVGVAELMTEFRNYDASRGRALRKHAESFHNAAMIVERLIKISKELINSRKVVGNA